MFVDTVVQDGFLVFVAFLMIEKNIPAGLAAFAVVATLAGGVIGKYACGPSVCPHGGSPLFGSGRGVHLLQGLWVLSCCRLLRYFSYCRWSVWCYKARRRLPTVRSDNLWIKLTSRVGLRLIYSMASGASVAGPVGFGIISDIYSVGAAVVLMAVVTLLPLGSCMGWQAGLNRADQ